MEELKSILWTYVCFAVGIALSVIAFFCDKPVNIVVAILALVCMFRVVALAFLQKQSWKIIVFRLAVTAAIAAEVFSFYGFEVWRAIFGWLASVGGVISFVNLIIFLNTLTSEDNLEKA